MMDRLPKRMVGMDGWYVANMLTGGDIKPPILLAMEPKPAAVCLKEPRALPQCRQQSETGRLLGPKNPPKRCWEELLNVH